MSIFTIECQNDRPIEVTADELQVRGPHRIAVRTYLSDESRAAWTFIRTTGAIVRITDELGTEVYA